MTEVLAANRIPLENYADVVGAGEIEELRALAKPLRGRSIEMINSTAVGGGVAEILNRLVPLAEELDLNIRWDVMKGAEEFFDVTKSFHNALHGEPYQAQPRDFEVFLSYNEQNRAKLPLDAEFMVIHDPQPAALIDARQPGSNHWVWRCHIDLSHPNRAVWDFLEKFVSHYDGAMFSSPEFSRQLSIAQYLFYPAIDPLSENNCALEEKARRGFRGWRHPRANHSQTHRTACTFRRRHGLPNPFLAFPSGNRRIARRTWPRTRKRKFSHHAKIEALSRLVLDARPAPMNLEKCGCSYPRWQLLFANPHLTSEAEASPGPGHSCFFCSNFFCPRRIPYEACCSTLVLGILGRGRLACAAAKNAK